MKEFAALTCSPLVRIWGLWWGCFLVHPLNGLCTMTGSFHLGREDVVSLYSCTVWLCLNTSTVVPEHEGNFAHRANEFISEGEEVSFDHTIVYVKNGHNATVVAGLSMCPVGFVFSGVILVEWDFEVEVVCLQSICHCWSWFAVIYFSYDFDIHGRGLQSAPMFWQWEYMMSIWIQAPYGNACPSLWWYTKKLGGVGTIRWGTFNQGGSSMWIPNQGWERKVWPKAEKKKWLPKFWWQNTSKVLKNLSKWMYTFNIPNVGFEGPNEHLTYFETCILKVSTQIKNPLKTYLWKKTLY